LSPWIPGLPTPALLSCGRPCYCGATTYDGQEAEKDYPAGRFLGSQLCVPLTNRLAGSEPDGRAERLPPG
jgi:hypothetical protein